MRWPRPPPRDQFHALHTQLADQQIYLKLASDLEDFFTQLHDKAQGASIVNRQRVLRLLVKDVLVGPDRRPPLTPLAEATSAQQTRIS